jgi:Zn-finger nucleic acid-binding protein
LDFVVFDDNPNIFILNHSFLFFPNEVLTDTIIGDIEMKCIHCEDEMIEKDIRGVEIDLCSNCAGVWLDSGELKELTKYDLSAGRILTCLRCEKPMQTKMIKGVEIDICPECSSIWLDGGEMNKISGLDISKSRSLQCPKCDDQLQTKMLRGVEIDICPGCTGVYLDKGEMEKLTAIEHSKGAETDIGQFLFDAHKIRIEVAIRAFKKGVHDKGTAADIAGVTIEEFEDMVKEAGK